MMKVTKCLLSILLLSAVSGSGIAQPDSLRFNVVEGPNGKPLGKIKSITQDRYGYMWFVSEGSQTLFRYDGQRWISFGKDISNPDALKANDPEKVYADDGGMIWIGGNGLDQFNPVTGIFKHYRHDDKDPGSLAINVVYTILKDHRKRLWVGTENGLDRLDENTGKFIHYRNEPGNPHSLSNNHVRSIFEDHQGVIWVGTGNPFTGDLNGGLNRLDSGYRFTRYLHDPDDTHSLGNNKVRSMYEDSRGIFWVGAGGNTLQAMDRKTGSFERHPYVSQNRGQINGSIHQEADWKRIHEQVTFICEDKTGGLWLGSMWSGITRYDPTTEKISLYANGNGFPDTSGWTGYISRDGVLWIGTDDSRSLYKGQTLFKPIPIIYTGNEVHDFMEDGKGGLWVGTNKGLLQMDQQKRLIHRFSHDPSDRSSLIDDLAGRLLHARSDTIWIGTDSGVEVFDSKTRQFSRFPLGIEYSSPWSGIIWDISQDVLGMKWFATHEGAVGYNPGDGTMIRYRHDEKDSGSILGNMITCTLKDRSGTLWISDVGGGKGGSPGVNRLISKTNHFQHYLEGYANCLLYEDSGGTVWVCTEKGLYRYDADSDSFSPFFDAQSTFNSDWIINLVEDNEKYLWFSTGSVLGRIDPSRKEYTVFGKKYGIKPESFSPKSAYRTEMGQILLGHDSGFCAFFPHEIEDSPVLKILVTDFFVNNIPVLPGSGSALQRPIEETVAIELAYNQKNMAFNFSAVDYTKPESIKYYTLLEGYDNTWREVLREKGGFYTNLSQGTYVFRIKAYDSEGLKGEKAITIIVKPPWWKTWWAYSIYGLLLVSLLFSADRVQKKRIIEKERQKAQVVELAQAKEIEKAYHELRAAQAQLIQSEKMASLGEMTAGIAHEIQNPLNFVNNFAEINRELIAEFKSQKSNVRKDVEQDVAETELLNDLDKNLEKISHHGQRADAIVKSMLQHSRTSTGQKEPTDINALADEYLKLAYHGLRAKDKSFNVTLKTDYDQSIGKINVIPQEIGRVLLNLYNNAFYAVNDRKKTQEAGYDPTVSVATKRSGNKLEIRVGDNGIGIPQNLRDKIFQPFFTTKPTGQGTGLGLSLSYDIIKAHGGGLKVKQQSDDKQAGENGGSEFIIELPIT
jgi:signal transduction histidine kinase/ligand-binding sensor domain-containing protein